MLQIHHADDDRSPSKLYADACWAANPRLSPDWWREALGHTVGKLAHDARHVVPAALSPGCNLVLASPRTWPEVVALVAAQPDPRAFVTVLVTPDPLPEITPAPTWLVWQPQENRDTAARRNVLAQLEGRVRAGTLEAYGLAPTPGLPLHLWLEDAAEAATTAWGRRKRPALRVLCAALDLLDLSLLTAPVARHREEAVSTLELAARLDLATLILPMALPDETPAPPAALAALTAAAQAEQALNHHLGGWPQQNGQPLFSLLAHLAQGQAPWPTPTHWHAWQAHVGPHLVRQWQTLPASLQIDTYLEALANLLPYGEALARHAAQPLLAGALAHLVPRFPATWHTEAPQTQALALLTSIPGVTAVAVVGAFNPLPLQLRPNLPDAGALLFA